MSVAKLINGERLENFTKVLRGGESVYLFSDEAASRRVVEQLNRSVNHKVVMRVLQVLIPVLGVAVVSGLLTNIYGHFHSGRFILNLVVLLMLVCMVIAMRMGRTITGIRVFLGVSLCVCVGSVLFNGGVLVPNYVGLLVLVVLASIFLSSRAMWGIYGVFVVVGGAGVVWHTDPGQLPTPFRYWTMYALFGLITVSALFLSRRAFQEALMRLADREALLSSAFASITQPLLVFDAQHQLVKMNPSAEALDATLRRDSDTSLLEVPCLNLDTLVQKTLVEHLELGASTPQTVRLCVLHMTHRRWIEVNTSAHILHGKKVGAVAFLRDVTDQHQLAQAQNMGALGTLASEIAHDFNNMVGAISNATEVLDSKLNGEHQELIDVLREASGRSTELTSSLLSFSRARSQSDSAVDVHQVLSHLKALLGRCHHKNIDLHLELSPDPLHVFGNSGQIQSALMNLGINGIQAMPDGGRLTIRTALVTLDQSELEGAPFEARPGQFVQIDVRDEGVGIPLEIQGHIFDPFFTTKPAGVGTGLGLAAVYRMVESHRGALDLVSSPGLGTTFRVWLPLHEVPVAPDVETPAQDVLDATAPRRILVVDDDALMRNSLRRMLRLFGHSAVTVADGASALEVVVNQGHFDLVILDLNMPLMTGDELFFKIRALNPQQPIVLSSGFTDAETLDLLIENGLAGVLEKPYSSSELSHIIQTASQSLH